MSEMPSIVWIAFQGNIPRDVRPRLHAERESEPYVRLADVLATIEAYDVPRHALWSMKCESRVKEDIMKLVKALAEEKP